MCFLLTFSLCCCLWLKRNSICSDFWGAFIDIYRPNDVMSDYGGGNSWHTLETGSEYLSNLAHVLRPSAQVKLKTLTPHFSTGLGRDFT